MTRALAREIGSRNITVNCVAPGFIDTDMTRALSEDQQNSLKANIPLARLGTPEDVAQAVAFLLRLLEPTSREIPSMSMVAYIWLESPVK